MMTELERYSVDHLFLLIGQNPLPNYLAAQLLLKEGGTVYLIHTSHTQRQSKYLETILKPIEKEDEQNIQPKSIKPNVIFEPLTEPNHYPREIRDAIARNLDQRAPGETVGLNYTGGNKVMAVHAHQAIQAYEGSVLSYLDSQRLEMCIEKEGRLFSKPVNYDVSLATIFTLHGIKLTREDVKKTRLLELGEAIAHKIFEANLSPEDSYKPIEQQAKQLAFEKAGLLNKNNKPDKEKIRELGSFGPPCKEVNNQVNSWVKAESGEWLEDYVLSQLSQIPKKYAINDYGIDVGLFVNEERIIKGHQHTLQLDVAFMRHYQLFAISCTTSSGSGCKLKLFEAYNRARQLGGTEARVALVCGATDAQKIKDEIEISIPDKKVAVFGRDDWEDLHERIAEWIDTLDERSV